MKTKFININNIKENIYSNFYPLYVDIYTIDILYNNIYKLYIYNKLFISIFLELSYIFEIIYVCIYG